MPTFKAGDMWSVFDQVDYFVVTTNSFIRNDGALVMGAGIAKQVRDRFPRIDRAAGHYIQNNVGHLGTYSLLMGQRIGLFQVKYHFKDKADLTLIKGAVQALTDRASSNPHKTYALNFPGIGNGGLSYDQVLPIVMELPDNVQVWTFR